MELDDLKQAWAAHGALLERNLAINEHLLRTSVRRRVRGALAPYRGWRALEVALGVIGLGLVTRVLAAHPTEARYLVVAGALAAFVAGTTALSVAVLVASGRLELDGPVARSQGALARVRRLEYRATRWAVLGGVVMWLPAALVLFEAVTGVAALGRVDLAWLVANLAFGVVVLVAGTALSRRYVEHPTAGPRARRFLDAVSGRALRRAADQLAELARFERDDA